MENKLYFDNELFVLLLKAYKKLKNHSLYDKTDLRAKKVISEFEYVDSENSEVVLTEIHKKLYRIALEIESGNILNRVNENSINPLYFPKTTMENKNDIIVEKIMLDYQFDDIFLCYLIGFAWIIKYGGYLDYMLGDNIYGNRLKEDFILEIDKKTFSTSTYKQYFRQFSRWRDNAIEKVIKLEDTEKILVNLDIKNFYYNVDIDWKKLEDFLETFDGFDMESCYIHRFVKKVIYIYSSLFELEKGIPIFFPPSKILSNWSLISLDYVFKDSSFLYYGRYVDDIVFVIESDDTDINSIIFSNSILSKIFKMKLDDNKLESIVITLLSSNITREQRVKLLEFYQRIHNASIEIEYDCFYTDKVQVMRQISDSVKEAPISAEELFNLIISSNTLINYTILNGSHTIQKEKLKVFKFNKDLDKNIQIEKLKSEMGNNTSDFSFLPDFDGKLNLNKLFTAIKGVLKFRDMDEISLNRYEFSKFIGQLSIDIEMYNQSYGYKDRYKEHVDFILNVLQGNVCLENRLQWEKIFNVLFKMNDFNSIKHFYNNCLKAIENIQVTSDVFLYDLKNKLVGEELRKNIVDNLEEYLRISLSSGVSVNFNLDLKINFDNNLSKKIKKANLSTYNNILSPIENYLTNYNDFSNYKLSLSPKFISFDDIQFFEISKILYKSRQKDLSKIDYGDLYRKFILINYYYNMETDISDNEYFYLRNLIVDRDSDSTSFSLKYDMNLFGENSVQEYLKNFEIAISSIKIDECSLLDNLKYQIKHPKKFTYSHKEVSQLREIINQSISNNVNMLIFPETSINLPNLAILRRNSKKHNIAMACGTKHIVIKGTAFNIAWMLLPFEKKFISNGREIIIRNLLVIPRVKNIYSPLEEIMIDQLGLKTPQLMYPSLSWDTYFRYEWNDVKFTLYNCYEISNIHHRAIFKGELDIFIVIEMNRDIQYFSNIVESMVRDMYCYVAQVNIANYGDSRITQPTSAYELDLAKIKGGENSYIVAVKLQIHQLRLAQDNRDYTTNSVLIKKYLVASDFCDKRKNRNTSWKPVPGKF
jgi:hypothetical protein